MMSSKVVHRFKTLSLNRGDGFIGKYAFGFLNISQFLSALNDNLFKFLTIYLLIDLEGASHSNDILFGVGIAYVLPFLLFSNVAGVLADRFSKQKLIVLLKALEVVVILGGFIAYQSASCIGCYFTVFMLSLQSALMGPAKYSIIPELVRKEQIAKASGQITSFTYLAIIIGTFLASFVTQITGKNFTLALVVCLIAAIVGFVTSLYIPHTAPRMNKQKISPKVLSQVTQTLKYCRKTPRLILAVLGSAFFLFIGAYLQLNLIPFAIGQLGLSEVGGGYLLFTMTLGIALGATLAGRACRKEVDLGLSTFAIMAIGLLLFLFPLLAGHLSRAILCLSVLGLFGGLFVVPLEAYIQSFSPSEIRGQVVATCNFLSFVGVLLAPLCLALFGKVFQVSPGAGFTLVGLLTLGVFFVMVKYLTLPFLHFFAKRLVMPFFDLHFIGYPFGLQHQEDRIAIVMKKPSLREIAVLLGESAKVHIFIVRHEKHFLDRFINQFSHIDVIVANEASDPMETQKKMDTRLATIKPLFLFTSEEAYHQFLSIGYFKTLAETYMYQMKRFRIMHTAHFKPSWPLLLKRIQLTLQFSEYRVVSSDVKSSLLPSGN